MKRHKQGNRATIPIGRLAIFIPRDWHDAHFQKLTGVSLKKTFLTTIEKKGKTTFGLHENRLFREKQNDSSASHKTWHSEDRLRATQRRHGFPSSLVQRGEFLPLSWPDVWQKTYQWPANQFIIVCGKCWSSWEVINEKQRSNNMKVLLINNKIKVTALYWHSCVFVRSCSFIYFKHFHGYTDLHPKILYLLQSQLPVNPGRHFPVLARLIVSVDIWL